MHTYIHTYNIHTYYTYIHTTYIHTNTHTHIYIRRYWTMSNGQGKLTGLTIRANSSSPKATGLQGSRARIPSCLQSTQRYATALVFMLSGNRERRCHECGFQFDSLDAQNNMNPFVRACCRMLHWQKQTETCLVLPPETKRQVSYLGLTE